MHPRLALDISWKRLLWAAVGAPSSAHDAQYASAAITDTFSSGYLVVGLSVRTIFDALLGELAVPAGASVLMTGVNIQNMADIVRAHELRVQAVDIAIDTLVPVPGALATAQAETAAPLCVVTQLFGSASHFDDLAELRGRGVVIIEDAAQAFSGTSHTGPGDADVSLFSFGPIKRRTALGGAVAVFRDADLAARVEQRLQRYRPLPDVWLRRRALKYLLLKAASMPWVYGSVMRAIAFSGRDPDAVIGAAARGFGGKALLEAIRVQPPRRLLVLMGRQISTTPSAGARREVCDTFARSLPNAARVGVSAHNNAYWLMPIRADNAEDLVLRLRRAGFDATRGATSLRALDPEHSEQARALIEDVVYVPNPADLAPDARDRLKQAVLSALRETR